MTRKIMVLILVISMVVCSVGTAYGIGNILENILENLARRSFLERRGILQMDDSGVEVLEEFIEAAQNEDIQAMYSMFAPAAISEIGEDVFETMIASFIEYYSGENVSVESVYGGQITRTHIDGKRDKLVEAPYIWRTTTNVYHLAVKHVPIDDFNADNIGIWSIYIIDSTKDSVPSNDMDPYLADLQYKSGIYFDVPRGRID